MIPINGQPLGKFPLTGLKKLRDLIYLDGPLLTHYVSKTGDSYLYYWCDCDDKHTRWMLIRVSEHAILQLIYRFIPLDAAILEGSLDGFIYIIDVAQDRSISKAWIISVPDIPDEYRPEENVFLDSIPTHVGQGDPVLMEGH